MSALLADIQTAYAESLKLGLTELQNRIEPPSKHEKKVILANHSARSDYGAEAAPLEKASAAKRRTASLRVKVLHAWDGSGLNAERFLFEYNEGRIAQEARAELGGKTLCQSTLYNWLGKYQHHDEAGLAPKYKGRGGNGASLDERTRELVWLYYSASTCKILTDTGGFSSGRISGCAGNRALRGSATAPAPAAPWLNPSNPLRTSTHPKGWIIRMAGNLAADFELIPFR